MKAATRRRTTEVVRLGIAGLQPGKRDHQIAGEGVGDQLTVPGLEDVERQAPARKERHVGEGKQLGARGRPDDGREQIAIGGDLTEVAPTKSGASTSVIVASSLISTCSDGPAVSLNGSPTVSPTTAALCGVGALAAVGAGLDVLLGVVPRAAAVVQERAPSGCRRSCRPSGSRPPPRRRSRVDDAGR